MGRVFAFRVVGQGVAEARPLLIYPALNLYRDDRKIRSRGEKKPPSSTKG